jgi:cobalt/nickel transport system permease protein
MKGTHAHAAGSGATHGRLADLPAACKVAAAVVWVVAVAATPNRAVWASAVHALLVTAVVRLGAVPGRLLLRRLALDIPFVVFALALPFVDAGPHTDVAGVALSTAGLWAMWGILAKATLGLLIAVVLGATTPVAELLRGMEQLRVPRLVVAIAGLMVRYLSVLTDDLGRMRIARISRGAEPRRVGHLRAAAAGAGTLFVRSYERGERVHLAMASRAFTGQMPDLAGRTPSARAWIVTGVPAIAAAATTVVALVAR